MLDLRHDTRSIKGETLRRSKLDGAVAFGVGEKAVYVLLFSKEL